MSIQKVYDTMQEDKIETFLTQIKSLDALALSIIEELKMCKLQKDMLLVEKETLEEELRLTRAENLKLKDSVHEISELETAVKPKPKKAKSKAVEPDAPTLF